MEPLNILLVDDSVEFGKLMKIKLAREAPDKSFHLVNDARQCLEYIKENKVDCILTDYQMPGMNGVELLIALNKQGSDVPVIFVTGQGSEEVAREAFKNGAYDYFTKDTGFTHFARINNSIEQAVRQRSAKRENRRLERNLREAEIRYHTVFEQSPDGILIIGGDGKFIEFNEAAHSQLGYTREEFAELRIADIDPVESPEEIKRSLEEVLNKGWAEFEVIHKTKSGETRNVNVIVRAMVLSGQAVFHAIWRDITERKQAEEKLLYFQMAVNSATDAIGMSTPEGIHYYQNEAFTNLFGLSVNDVNGVSGPPATVFADEKTGRKVFETVKRGGLFVGEVKMLDKGRNQKDIYIRAYPIKDKEGQVVGLVGMHTDITEKKLAEERLQKSERQLRESQKAARLGSWDLDLAALKLDWSDETYRLFDQSPVTFHPSFDEFARLVHPEDRDAMRTKFDQALASDGSPYHVVVRVVNDSGREWVMEAFGAVRRDENGKPIGIYGTAQDVTERKQIENRLLQITKAVESSSNAIGISDADAHHIYHNKAYSELFEYNSAEELEAVGGGAATVKDPAVARELFEDIMQGKTWSGELELVTKSGRVFPAFERADAITDEHGRIVGLIGIITDITERKLAEEKLRQNEQFIRNILDTVDEGFIVIDRDFRILTANRAYYDQVAKACGEVIGRRCYEVSHRSSRPCYEMGEDCATRHVFETGKPYSSLHKHTDANGVIMYVETKGFPIMDGSGAVTSVIETVNNITEKHLLEDERLKTQKLESIGTLAGGIAHDFNNLLQGIFGYISMAKMTYDQREKSLAMLEQAEKALHQSVNLTAQLLTFSKGGKPVKNRLDLRPVIEDSAKFMLSGSRSDLRMDIPADLWQAEADGGQLGQLIQNIVLNADQSMPSGGSVIVTAKNVAEGDASLPSGLARGNYIRISIQDTGVGIPEQNLDKIFDPYFTTKEKGSGLGLATSYSIVRNHGGIIDIKTKPGEGSTFMVYLPATSGEPQASTSDDDAPANMSLSQTARVLVMDDGELLRAIGKKMLEMIGHEAEVAKDGREAVEKYRQAMASGKPFDVVILDLTIRGGMGGVETVRKLREIDPAVRAIVSSGYSDDAATANHLSYGFKAYLKKPYDITELRDTLATVLLQSCPGP